MQERPAVVEPLVLDPPTFDGTKPRIDSEQRRFEPFRDKRDLATLFGNLPALFSDLPPLFSDLGTDAVQRRFDPRQPFVRLVELTPDQQLTQLRGPFRVLAEDLHQILIVVNAERHGGSIAAPKGHTLRPAHLPRRLRMRVGVSLTSAHQTLDVRAGARWMIERAAAANEAGLDSLFVGDHHGTPSPYYQNTVILARVLAEWGDKPAGCLFLLPLWNPVLVAEQVGTLASIHRGRFIMQCALGVGREQFQAMGADIGTRPSAFTESLDIIRRLLAGETVDGGRRFPAIRGAHISPVPPEPVEVWIGGSAEASIDRAARLGEAWLGGPELTPDLARHWAAYYRRQCETHGRTPTAVALRRDVFVGESDAHAAEVAGPIVDAGYRGFESDACVYGSPDTVAAKFRMYRRLGYTDIIIRHLTDDQDQVLGSMKRLKEVRQAVAHA